MNDIATLAAQLRRLSHDLPRGSLRQAADNLHVGQVELTEAGRDSVEPIGLGPLRLSQEKLDQALHQLETVVHAIDSYVAAIGANGGAATARSGSSSSTPAPSRTEGDGQQWWIDAINALCDRDGKPDKGSGEVAATTVFSDLARMASAGDAAGYHRTLLDIGPGTGVKLPGLSWPMIRSLASETLGRHPTTHDTATLRERTFGRVRSVLPGVDEERAEEQLASACSLTARRRDGDDDEQSRSKAAEAAALGPALVASLHQQRESA